MTDTQTKTSANAVKKERVFVYTLLPDKGHMLNIIAIDAEDAIATYRAIGGAGAILSVTQSDSVDATSLNSHKVTKQLIGLALDQEVQS